MGQTAFVRAKPRLTVGQDIASGIQRADPTAGAYNAPQRGQGDVKFLPEGSELNLQDFVSADGEKT